MFELNYQKKTDEIVNWLSKTVNDAGFGKVIVAVSGGVDSATSLFLAVKALGVENVYAVLLPYGAMGTLALEHGKLVVQAAGLPKDHIYVGDIQPGVEKLWETVERHSGEQSDSRIQNGIDSGRTSFARMTDVRKGNIMARVRMIYLFDFAKSLNALVVGTENKTEHYLGYFTRFGDEASDIEPIRSLYKTQVWDMAKHVGVPQEIITKAPSANLWEGQFDEGEFGFSYADADKVLYMHFEEGKSEKEIFASGIDEKIIKNVLDFVEKNDFKHHVPKVFK